MTPQERRKEREEASIERIRLLEERLFAAIDYNAEENDVSQTEVIGTLEMIKFRMLREALGLDREDEEEEEEEEEEDVQP